MLDQGVLKVATRTYEKPIAFVIFFVMLTVFAITTSSFWRYFRSLWFGSYTPKVIASSVCGVMLAFGSFGLPLLIQDTTQIDYYIGPSAFLGNCYLLTTIGFWIVVSVECEAFLSSRRATADPDMKFADQV